jgi:hypothetical protein
MRKEGLYRSFIMGLRSGSNNKSTKNINYVL